MSILLTWQAALPMKISFNLTAIALPELFRPLLRPTLELQSAILGVPDSTLRPPAQRPRDDYAARSNAPSAAEIFTDGKALYIVTVRTRVQIKTPTRVTKTDEPHSNVILTYFGPPDHVAAADSVKEAIETLAAVELDAITYRSQQFEDLRSEGREGTQPPTAGEKLAIESLRDRLTRALLIAIKTSGGLLLRDLPRQLPTEDRGRTDAIRKELTDKCLIDSEVVVICGKSQTQTAVCHPETY